MRARSGQSDQYCSENEADAGQNEHAWTIGMDSWRMVDNAPSAAKSARSADTCFVKVCSHVGEDFAPCLICDVDVLDNSLRRYRPFGRPSAIFFLPVTRSMPTDVSGAATADPMLQ